MAKSKLVAAKNGRLLLVRRRRDKLWMFPDGRKHAGESDRRKPRRIRLKPTSRYIRDKLFPR
nr:hypothetical protein [Bradyrhizobium liaoningense]